MRALVPNGAALRIVRGYGRAALSDDVDRAAAGRPVAASQVGAALGSGEAWSPARSAGGASHHSRASLRPYPKVAAARAMAPEASARLTSRLPLAGGAPAVRLAGACRRSKAAGGRDLFEGPTAGGIAVVQRVALLRPLPAETAVAAALIFARPGLSARPASAGSGRDGRPASAQIEQSSCWKPACSASFRQSVSGAAWMWRKASGGVTFSIRAGTSTPRASASAASAFTHPLASDVADQRTTAQDADASSRSISSSQVLPGGMFASHHTDQPCRPSAAAIRSAARRSSRA